MSTMEVPDIDTSVAPVNKLSIVLLMCGFAFHWLQDVSIESAYIWFYRALAVISISLVIILNAIKLVEWWKKRKLNEHKD